MTIVDRTASPSPDVLEAVIAVQQEVAESGLGLDHVVRLVTLRARELTGASGAHLELVDGGELLVRSASGTSSALAGQRLPVGGTLSDEAMRTGRTHLVDDVESEPLVDAAAGRDIGARSMVVAPVRASGVAGGALKVVSDRPAVFRAEDARAVELLAGVVSAALGRASGHELRSRQELQDPLTGLANRALFLDHLRAALGRLSRRRSTVAVLSVDLDGFEDVNTALGREVGDRLLVAAGGRIREIVRGTDTVARLGGDDYAVVCEDAGGPRGAGWVAERIIEWLSRPFRIGGHEVLVGASVGIAVTDRPDADPEDLVRESAQAMYAAKADGKGTHRFARGAGSAEDAASYTGDTTA
ncbi:MAG TPA: sensor domain-containing diguanylate cyclase [Actinomycetota bacterium]|nr:sensor domain-containing diguanylate cyclase [Actinomycetota bacterium]